MSGPRRLSVPRRVAVEAGEEGRPLIVDGRDEVVFHDLEKGRWWRQR